MLLLDSSIANNTIEKEEEEEKKKKPSRPEGLRDFYHCAIAATPHWLCSISIDNNDSSGSNSTVSIVHFWGHLGCWVNTPAENPEK